MRSWLYIFSAICLALIFSPAPGHGVELVVGGQYYRRHSAKDYRTLSPVKLYRLDLTTKKLTRITHGEGNDFDPRWSPDGQWIVFARYHDNNRTEIRLARRDGSDEKRLFYIPKVSDNQYLRIEWLPGGHSIALCYAATGAAFIVLSTEGRVQQRVPGVVGFSLSPSGRFAYFERNYFDEIQVDDAVYDLETRTLTPVRINLTAVRWNSEEQFEGLSRGIKDPHVTITTANVKGKTLAKRILWAGDDAGDIIWYGRNVRLPSKRTDGAFLVQNCWFRSDGDAYDLSILRPREGKGRLIGEYEYIGRLDEPARVLVCMHDWAGPYKWGGVKVGTLYSMGDDGKGFRRVRLPGFSVSGGGDCR